MKPKLLSVCGTAMGGMFNADYLRNMAQATRRWAFARERRGVKAVTLRELLQSPLDISMRVDNGSFGDASLYDVTVLCTLVKMCGARKAFEFGTFRGSTTLQIAKNIATGGRVYTLDVTPEQRGKLPAGGWDTQVDDSRIGELFRSSPLASSISQIFCDSREFDPKPYAGQMDFIFIDACHDYEFVKNDTEKSFIMAAPGAIVAWHDYALGFDGLRQYIEGLTSSREVYWVKDSSVAFCRMH